MKKFAVLLFVLIVGCASAHAQDPPMIVNPASVAFGASPDHNTTVGTQSVVTVYKLDVIVAANNTPAGTFDLGKPTPNGSNDIVVASPFTTLPPGVYWVEAYPEGPGGPSETKLRGLMQLGVMGRPRPATGQLILK